jgi:Tol biopolymer transport system component
MNAQRHAAILLGAWLACWQPTLAESPPTAKRAQLVVSPNAWGSELRLVEIGGRESQTLPTSVTRPIFPSWREKGRQIVFASGASGRVQIYSMDVAGGAARNLTNSSANDDQPLCSPDGNKILFTSNRDGNQEVYVMDSDGQNVVNLTHDPGFDSDAVWSPDGKRIAFASDRSGKGFHLMVMDADGANPHNVIDRNLGGMLYPCWSPDGQQLAFAALVQPDVLRLHVVNADGAGLQELTDGPGMSCYPAWSPDGRYLAYVYFAKHPNQSPEGGRVTLIDLEEGSTSEFAAGAPPVTASRMAWRIAEE